MTGTSEATQRKEKGKTEEINVAKGSGKEAEKGLKRTGRNVGGPQYIVAGEGTEGVHPRGCGAKARCRGYNIIKGKWTGVRIG